MDTVEAPAAAVSPYRGKLFKLYQGTLLFTSSKGWWPDREDGGAQAFYHEPDFCLGLDGRSAHVDKKRYSGEECDFIEVLIDQKVWWVAEVDIVV